MPRRILLVGGDEFRPPCAAMDANLLVLARPTPTGLPQPRVAIIPTAAALENPRRAADHGVRYFTSLGANAHSIDIINPPDAHHPDLVNQIAGANLIYFTGGSPEHLLTVLQDSPLLDAVTDANHRGAIWAGSSAGAMVLGARMRRPSASNGVAALSIIPGIIILPHHERSDPAAVAAQLDARNESDLVALGIDGATGILLDPDNATVTGAGNATVYRSGSWQRYAAGDRIPNLTINGPV